MKKLFIFEGFSLVEMLMALLVASLLLAALAPVMTKKINEKVNFEGLVPNPTRKKIVYLTEPGVGEWVVPNNYNGPMTVTLISAGGGGGTAPTAGYTEYTTAGSTNTFTVPAMVNQIEVHPCFSQKEIVNYCNNYKIQVIGWSPIMKGQLLEVPLMIDLAEKYNKTIAQIALRWHIQKGIIPIPKSSHYGRIADNIDIFNFELSEEDMIKIDKLDRNETVSGIPENTTYNDFKW